MVDNLKIDRRKYKICFEEIAYFCINLRQIISSNEYKKLNMAVSKDKSRFINLKYQTNHYYFYH